MSQGKPDGGWGQLTAEARAARIQRMLTKRAANKRGPLVKRKKDEVEVETISIPVPAHPRNESGATLDSLAQLIVAVWKKL